MDVKTRFSTLFDEKERAEEDIYFAQRDRELIAKLHQQQEAEQEQTLCDLVRSRCPRCGKRLRQRAFHGVMIDGCPNCQGLWFDKSEIHALGQDKGEGWTAHFLQDLIHLLLPAQEEEHEREKV